MHRPSPAAFLTGVTLALGAAFSTAALASGPDESKAETCLRTKVWEGYADGWGIRTMTTTTLTLGGTRNYLVTLYKGNEYRISTCSDDGMVNLDVYLYDLNGNPVVRDNTSDRQPSIEITPEKTSTYYIVLHARELVDAQAESAAAMAVTYR